ncbi:hypothetical protein H6G20_21780 [Desertifilum sp. FACHB-1129]|uniref:hypothetical protein n=1 Tax=unclassified Desertifilum TaxID=2621682 RepID=UPI001681FE79|nr:MULTISPECIES: hypothetical protein [unclassified Desertifilum]MBD2314303.1 hypothetical protein [Desertifilum sp. FACHB-1129]MBD2320406.1 hypothetical protein [Desertifilum sp. FACHB-866]MBD2330534.1 hypothetical protein [Desertifilum sp. FACHB-868]MDA0211853.1 hypothetical protein [Cyanobacteria bacterium FC1]
MPKQKIVIGMLANAGGAGKTTLAVHLAYETSEVGQSLRLSESALLVFNLN